MGREWREERWVGAGTAFPAAIAVIPLGTNVDTRDVMKRFLEQFSDCPTRYSSLGDVRILASCDE